MTTAQATLQATSIVPSFTVNDLTASVRFYEGLGFTIEERWEHDGALLGVMLRAGKIQLGLNQDDWEKGRDRVKGVGQRVWIGTDQDVDEVAARARAAGVRIEEEPHDTPWGTRAFTVVDPDGFRLTVSREGQA